MQRPSNWRGTLALNSLDIIVLIAFGVVQPLFGLLARSPGFFLAHRSKPIDLVALVLCAYAVPAALPLLIEWLVALVKPRAVAALHTSILALLLSINTLPVAKRLGLPGVVSLLIAVAAGAFLAIVYMRIRSWSRSLVYLSPAVLLFPALLLFFSPASKLFLPGRSAKAIRSSIESPAPVVVVVFDEFPLASLMDKDGQIDSKAYPNFAQLARSGSWYRNVTTSGQSTLLALPVILTGLYPDPNQPRLPEAGAYPDNLFTLLGAKYRMNVNENNTRLCPDALCADAGPAGPRIASLLEDAAVLSLYTVLPADFTRGLPDITQSWSNLRTPSQERPTMENWREFEDMTDFHDRPRQFREFVDSIRPSPRPTLNFLHILLPHSPWVFLPSGKRCMRAERIRGLRGVNDAGLDAQQWTGDARTVAQNYQRHLLQVGFVDRLTGSLVKHLQETGLYDSTLLVVTADHGCSFRAGDSRRVVTATNHADIMSVPLFIKYPHQQHGGIDDRNAESVDILPTILDALGLKTDYRPDGRSLLGSPVPGRRSKRLVTDAEQTLNFPAGLDGLFASVSRKLELFGGGEYDPYRLGDRYGWIGRMAPATAAASPIRCRLDREAYYGSVDPAAPVVLTNIAGRLQRAQANGHPAPLQLAVAVNGTVRATTETYFDDGQEKFAALVPEDALRAGRNDIAVYDLRGPDELRSIQLNARQQYAWGTELLFGDKGNAGPFYGIGWSNPESGITWTDGHLATLVLPAPPPKGDVTLTASFSGFVSAGKLVHQTARLLVNRHEVVQWVATGDFQDHTATIPKECLRGTVVEIQFDLPDAASPMEMGTGTDPRTLGLAMLKLTLAPQNAR